MGTPSTPDAKTNPGFTNNVLEQLKADEGLRTHPYRDSVGKLTVGYGRNLSDDGISVPEAEFMLFNDFDFALHSVYRYLPWATKLDDARLGVLVNMAFNMGIDSLLTFHNTLAHVEAGDYDLAATDMQNSLWAKQVGARADRLVQQMRSGCWIFSKL